MFAQFNQTFARTIVGTLGTALCATACLVGATAPAHAATVDGIAQQTVRYADLDLSREAGRAAFDSRIRHAANVVCSGYGDDLQVRSLKAACVREAVDGALPKIVAALDSAKNG